MPNQQNLACLQLDLIFYVKYGEIFHKTDILNLTNDIYVSGHVLVSVVNVEINKLLKQRLVQSQKLLEIRDMTAPPTPHRSEQRWVSHDEPQQTRRRPLKQHWQ